MTMKKTLIALLTLAGASAFAQTPGTNTPRVDQREANQQQRIDAGRRDGSLTRSEAYRLQQGEQRKGGGHDRNAGGGCDRGGRRQRYEGLFEDQRWSFLRVAEASRMPSSTPTPRMSMNTPWRVVRSANSWLR